MSEAFNNFLADYRSCTGNNAPLVSMGEERVKNLFERCSKAGFIVLEGLSREQICEIIEILKETKFSFMPIYRKLDNGGETPLFERGVVVFNYNSCGSILVEGTKKDLFAFGQRLAKQFDKESFLFETENGVLSRFDGEGSAVGCEDKGLFFNGCFVNPAPQCYSERHIRYLRREIFLSR